MSVMVLGLGNILLSDEGIGVRVVEHLSQRYQFSDEVELMDGGTAGMELLGPLMNRSLVIVVDAVRTGRLPGQPVVLRGDEVPRFFRTKLSPHQVHLADVLAALELMNAAPGELVVVGIEPVSLATGLDLTPEVEEKLPYLIELVLGELVAAGFPAGPITNAPRSQLLEAGAFAVN